MTELVWSFFWLWHLLPGPGHSTPTPAGQLSIVGTAFSWPENEKKVQKDCLQNWQALTEVSLFRGL